jgi:hypothetical protein
MSKTGFSIAITSIALVIYVAASATQLAFPFVFLFLMTTQALFIWMVCVILRDDRPSKRTFEEYFYEDAELRRNNPARKSL